MVQSRCQVSVPVPFVIQKQSTVQTDANAYRVHHLLAFVPDQPYSTASE